MRGNKDDVLRCLTEVYSVLDGVPPRGPFRYYDPSTYNGYNVADYGGYLDNTMGNNQPNLRGNIASGYVNNPYVPPQGYPPYGGGYPDDNYGGNRNRASGFNPMYQQGGQVTTTQVTVPTEMAGKLFEFSLMHKFICLLKVLLLVQRVRKFLKSVKNLALRLKSILNQ
jgi:hypothetical protein